MKSSKPASRLRIRTILLVVNIIILILPLGSIYFLKIYEDELVHQTESELVAQGATIVSVYSQVVEGLQTSPAFQSARFQNYGLPVEVDPRGYYQLIPQPVEFSKETIAPPFPEAQKPDASADLLARTAGKRLIPILKNTRNVTLAGIRLTDIKGIVVATSGSEYGLSLNHAPEIQQALQGQPTSLLRKRVADTRAYSWTSTSRDTGLRVFVTLPIISKHRVIGTALLSRTPRSIKKALFDIKGRIIGAVLLLLIIITFLTLFTSLTISRPVNTLISRTRAIASGRDRPGNRNFKPVTREFELLNTALNDMADQINIRSDYIKNFALNVSHEFKTPLTSIQGTLELFQNYLNSMSEDKKERFLNNMLEDTHRLKKLVNRLLEMAKADVFQPNEDSTELLAYLNQIKERYSEKGLSIELTGESKETEITIGPDIFDIIISNLLDNSLQHGASSVTICIVYDKTIRLKLKDNGEGISKSNAEQIFTPFFSTAKKSGGTGLGLPIIKTLLQTHGGEIKFNPTETGAQFDIFLNSTNSC